MMQPHDKSNQSNISRKGEYRVPDKASPAECSSCHAPIVWTKTSKGKRIPLSMATVRTDEQGVRWALNHFADCPQAAQHRKPAEYRAANEKSMTRAAPPSFLCGRCKSVMCEDCISIAEEYQQLEQNRKLAMLQMENELGRTRAELAMWKRRAEVFGEVSKAGLHDIICAWMDNNFNRLLQTPGATASQGQKGDQQKGNDHESMDLA